MKSIYETVIERVRNGAKLMVDFKQRAISLDNKPIDITSAPAGIETFDNLDEWLDHVEDLYDDYKYSRPDSSSDTRHSKFKALSVEELVKECGHDALSNPLEREEARAALEVFILLSLVNGSFKPEILFAKDWFYQGGDKSFIMLKDWF